MMFGKIEWGFSPIVRVKVTSPIMGEISYQSTPALYNVRFLIGKRERSSWSPEYHGHSRMASLLSRKSISVGSIRQWKAIQRHNGILGWAELTEYRSVLQSSSFCSVHRSASCRVLLFRLGKAHSLAVQRDTSLGIQFGYIRTPAIEQAPKSQMRPEGSTQNKTGEVHKGSR